MKIGDSAKKLKTQIWSSVVTIVLVDGTALLPMDDNGFSDPYVKFRLGAEKYRSKVTSRDLSALNTCDVCLKKGNGSVKTNVKKKIT